MKLVAKFSFYFAKVLVHNPQAYPEMNGKSVVIESNKENFISVSASHTKGYQYLLAHLSYSINYMSISWSRNIYQQSSLIFRSSVRDMSAKNRGCLFSDERNIPGSEVGI